MKDPKEIELHESVGSEVSGIIGGVARRVPDKAGKAADSMLAVYKHRFTYTFIYADEVASIHFDQARKEIFFRGRNIKHLDLSEDHLQAFWDLAEVLAGDREGLELLNDYRTTLAHALSDNSNAEE